VEANSRLIDYSPDSHDYLPIPLFYILLWLASPFRFKSPRLPAANEDLTKHLVYFIEGLPLPAFWPAWPLTTILGCLPKDITDDCRHLVPFFMLTLIGRIPQNVKHVG